MTAPGSSRRPESPDPTEEEEDAVDVVSEKIVHATLVRADPEEVYAAIATAEGLDSWFTEGAIVDPRPGGRLEFRWTDWGPDRITTVDEGRVLEAVTGRSFVFEWHPDGPSYPTTVSLSFRAVPAGTIVRVSEEGYRNTASGRAAMLDCACGWGEALTLLKVFVEHGVHY